MQKTKTASPVATRAAKKPKLATLFERLESSNAAFLDAAAAQSLATELARARASSAAASYDPAAGAAPSQRAATPLRPSIGDAPALGPAEVARRAERRQRFLEEQASAAAAARVKHSAQTLVQARTQGGAAARGANQSLEKEYLRLTSLPSVSDVRPPLVLRQALEMVQRKWAQGCDYLYACDQLKSIRQDLTVQHVRSALTVAVYETHARIALEVGDWAELRQSHAVLRQLYGEGLGGERCEFAAYGVMLAAASGRDVLALELKEAVGGPAGVDPGEPMLAHALAACAAFSANNYVALLKLYPAAPRMGAYLLDLLVQKMRPRAYAAMLAAYHPSLPVAAVAAWLGCASEAEARDFVRGHGAVVEGPGGVIDVRRSRGAMQGGGPSMGSCPRL